MAKPKTIYSCTECGGQTLKWQGQCPHCQAWNTLVETIAEKSVSRFSPVSETGQVQNLSTIEAREEPRYPTGIEELDRVLGGGIVAGGVVRPRDRGIVGEAAVDFIRQFKVDIALIGISGIEPDGSLRDFDYREVKVAQTIIEHAREVWLAADFSKFNRPAMVQLATLAQIDRLFTDAPPPEPFPALLQDAEVLCTVAA